MSSLNFNDLPEVMSQVLCTVERLECKIVEIQKEMKHVNNSEGLHVPMRINEACEFLKMKKSTMYYHIEKGNIPATKSGKNYILFKDELLHWLETGRRNRVSLTPEEQNRAILMSQKRKPRNFNSIGL